MSAPTLSPTLGPTGSDELDESAMYYSIALAVALVPASIVAVKSKFNSSYLPCILAERLERFETNNEATVMSFIIPTVYGVMLLPVYLVYMVGSSLAEKTDAREGIQASLFLTCVLSGLIGLGRLWSEGWWFRPEVDPRKHLAETLGLVSDGERARAGGRSGGRERGEPEREIQRERRGGRKRVRVLATVSAHHCSRPPPHPPAHHSHRVLLCAARDLFPDGGSGLCAVGSGLHWRLHSHEGL